MISGDKAVDGNEITADDLRLLKQLMNGQCALESSRNLFDEVIHRGRVGSKFEAVNKKYMRSMFELYCESRDTIIVQMDAVHTEFRRLSKLIISERIPNLILFNMLGLLFPLVTEVGVYAVANKYRFDFQSMLNEISKPNCKHFERIQIRCRHGEDEGSWICEDWNNDLEFKFHQKNWRALLEVGQGADFDDVLTLTKAKSRKRCRRVKSHEAQL